MRTKRYDFNFKPLQVNICMVVEGSVPDSQNYNADADEYTPDYTLVGLTIQPAVSIMDKDEILTPGRINQSLANIKWYEVGGDGTDTVIESTNTSYEITTSGANTGRIVIKKNAKPQVPLNLKFYAEYTDPRTGQLHIIQEPYVLKCNNSTSYIPILLLDAADQTIYNPLADEAKQTVHASLRLGENECPEAMRKLVWEILRDDNTYSEVGTDEVLDYDVVVSDDGTYATVDRSLMGDELHLRCRAKYDRGGNPDGVTLSDASPKAEAAFIRRIPKFEYDIVGTPTNIPSGLLAIAPEAYIWGANGSIDDPERELRPIWYAATNAANGSLSYKQVATGMTPILSTDMMSDLRGAVYGLEVEDCGSTCAFTDSDDAVIVDDEDNVILIK